MAPPAIRLSSAATSDAGAAIQTASAARDDPSATWSARPKPALQGGRPERTSQLRVKLGVTRPPITRIISTVAASPRRRPALSAANPPRKAARWNPRLPSTSAPTSTRILRLRQFFPAMISRASTAASAIRKARSMPTTHPAGSHPDSAIAIRPASHSAASAATGQPTTGIRPVQFGTAVSRKPAITALA